MLRSKYSDAFELRWVGDCVFNKKRSEEMLFSVVKCIDLCSLLRETDLKILARARRGDCGRPSARRLRALFSRETELAHIHVRDEHLARRQLRPSWRGHFAWARRDLAQAGHVTSTSDLAGRRIPREFEPRAAFGGARRPHAPRRPERPGPAVSGTGSVLMVTRGDWTSCRGNLHLDSTGAS